MIASADLAVVVDGAGIPFGGCHHGVAWYARQLGVRTMAALVASPDVPLVDGLAAGIAAVAALHVDTCDLTNPGTPCAAVGVLRVGPDRVDALALSDVSVVVDLDTGPEVTCDLSIEEISGTEPAAVAGMRFGTPEHANALAALVARQTATRNRPDGWWVAAADPAAAQYARTASYPIDALVRATVFSDGATRPVDQMEIYRWPEFLDLLEKLGPAGLIAHVRSLEAADPHGDSYPRTKRHDDASLAQLMLDKPLINRRS
ncbi:integrase [Micromonospora endolithica]|uniref:Integrase n=1 Tax=Micromonospora endolithica TaxID=230091 RepID=A0A3A9YPL9_9ACTN|nr:integrase [Micromonospora endolithica]